MHTYFLIRNKSATENEIMGKPMKDLDSGHEPVQSVPEGKTETIPSSHQPGRVNLTHIFLLEHMNINTIPVKCPFVFFFQLLRLSKRRTRPQLLQ